MAHPDNQPNSTTLSLSFNVLLDNNGTLHPPIGLTRVPREQGQNPWLPMVIQFGDDAQK